MRRAVKIGIIVVIIVAVAAIGLHLTVDDSSLVIIPQVWSQYSPYGASYEFKVNQAILGPNDGLETGLLSTMDRVVVTDTKGIKYELDRDFNINEYSGEVTRRFVLYGPEEARLPETGRYRFDFIKDGETVFDQAC